MSFIERLQYYMAQKNINDNKITVDAGLSIGLIGKAKKSGKAMNSANIEKILLAYPDLNSEWLLTGKGEMLKTKCSSNAIPSQLTAKATCKSSKNNQDTQQIIQETRPRIPLEAAAGSLSVLTQSINQSQCDQIPVIASLPDYDFTIMVKGDSMMPEFKSGDEVACRLIRESAFIQWGQPYVVDSYNGIVLKRIHDSGDCIKCVSDNPQYGTFHIPKSEIYRLALVVGMIRSY